MPSFGLMCLWKWKWVLWVFPPFFSWHIYNALRLFQEENINDLFLHTRGAEVYKSWKMAPSFVGQHRRLSISILQKTTQKYSSFISGKKILKCTIFYASKNHCNCIRETPMKNWILWNNEAVFPWIFRGKIPRI